jgi:excinuclease UvrABC helicase subunit UvrB
MSTTASLLSSRRDILVVASVSCLYGIGNPVEFQKNLIPEKGQIILELNYCINSCKVYIQEQKPILILEISE